MYQEGKEGRQDEEDPEGIVHLAEGKEGSRRSFLGAEVHRSSLEAGKAAASLEEAHQLQEALEIYMNEIVGSLINDSVIPMYLGPLIIMPPGPPNPGGGPEQPINKNVSKWLGDKRRNWA